MPLTREQSNYINTGGTVFLPSVAIDSTLGVLGNSVFSGPANFNNNLTVSGQVGIGNTSPTYKLEVSSTARVGGTTANTGTGLIVNGQAIFNSIANWNFGSVEFVRNAANTATPRFLGFNLDGDSLSNTTIGATNSIWGIYDSSPTTGSTSSALNSVMGYGAYAGHRWYNNGTERMRLAADGSSTFSPGVSLSGTNAPFKITSPSTGQGLTSGITLYSTFTGTGDNGPRRTVDIIAGYSGGSWGNEYLSFNVGFGGQNDSANLTTERLRISGLGVIKLGAALAESATVSATAAATTVIYDVMTNKNVLYYTSNATADWTFNVRGNASTTLNTLMDIGQSLTVVFMNTSGATAYRPTAFQVDGTAVTPKWFGGTAPTAGNVSSIDVYTYNIIKTASATYTVLASQNKFA